MDFCVHWHICLTEEQFFVSPSAVQALLQTDTLKLVRILFLFACRVLDGSRLFHRQHTFATPPGGFVPRQQVADPVSILILLAIICSELVAIELTEVSINSHDDIRDMMASGDWTVTQGVGDRWNHCCDGHAVSTVQVDSTLPNRGKLYLGWVIDGTTVVMNTSRLLYRWTLPSQTEESCICMFSSELVAIELTEVSINSHDDIRDMMASGDWTVTQGVGDRWNHCCDGHAVSTVQVDSTLPNRGKLYLGWVIDGTTVVMDTPSLLYRWTLPSQTEESCICMFSSELVAIELTEVSINSHDDITDMMASGGWTVTQGVVDGSPSWLNTVSVILKL
ncbi:hypothetical protein J6590_006876 [Homalodisca vitripennis]|nr:hypothetical protein J6590_006876 [Homalodisca vitripennis]